MTLVTTVLMERTAHSPTVCSGLPDYCSAPVSNSMTEESLERAAQYEAAYRGGHDAVLSVLSGVVWAVLGAFGVGLLWMTAIALSNGTASPATFGAALFGVAITVLAGDELIHRFLGGPPVF
jgi:hypothetical protein